MPEGDDGGACVFEVLAHPDCARPIEGDLADVEALTEAADVVLDVGVVDDVAFGGVEVALLLPQVVGRVVAGDAECKVVLRDPELRRDPVVFVVAVGREDENERGDVGG